MPAALALQGIAFPPDNMITRTLCRHRHFQDNAEFLCVSSQSLLPTLKEVSCHQTSHALQTSGQTAHNHRHFKEGGDIAGGKSELAVQALSGFGMEINLRQRKMSRSRDEPSHSVEAAPAAYTACVREATLMALRA